MAHLGVLTTEFQRPDLESALDAVKEHEISYVQLQLGSAVPELPTTTALTVGLTALGQYLDEGFCEKVRRAHEARALVIAAVDGTFNMVDPDESKRRAGLDALLRLIELCPVLGTSVVTLCTGTRDPMNMWKPHSDNATEAAWLDLLDTMGEAANVAAEHKVTLAFEPEVSSVVDSASRARRLIDEIGSPWVKVLFDAANIFHTGELSRMREMFDEAFDLIGPDIVLAHAKDLDHDGAAGHLPAGRGVLDYPYYLMLLQKIHYEGAVVLHALSGIQEGEYDSCFATVRQSAPDGFFEM